LYLKELVDDEGADDDEMLQCMKRLLPRVGSTISRVVDSCHEGDTRQRLSRLSWDYFAKFTASNGEPEKLERVYRELCGDGRPGDSSCNNESTTESFKDSENIDTPAVSSADNNGSTFPDSSSSKLATDPLASDSGDSHETEKKPHLYSSKGKDLMDYSDVDQSISHTDRSDEGHLEESADETAESESLLDGDYIPNDTNRKGNSRSKAKERSSVGRSAAVLVSKTGLLPFQGSAVVCDDDDERIPKKRKPNERNKPIERSSNEIVIKRSNNTKRDGEETGSHFGYRGRGASTKGKDSSGGRIRTSKSGNY